MSETHASGGEAPRESGSSGVVHKLPQPGIIIDGWIWTLENDTKEADWFWENRKRTSREKMIQFMLEHGRKRKQFTPMWDTRRCQTPLPGMVEPGQASQREQTLQNEQEKAEHTAVDSTDMEWPWSAMQNVENSTE